MTNPHTPTKAGESASELEALAAKIEGNHIISGGNGPNFSMGWSMANEVSARMVREFAATPSPADRAASVGAVLDASKLVEKIRHHHDECADQAWHAGNSDEQVGTPYFETLRLFNAALDQLAALATPQSLPIPQADVDQLRRKWLGHRDTGHLSLIEAADHVIGGLHAEIERLQAERSDTERLDWMLDNIGTGTMTRADIDTAMRTTAAATSEGASHEA